MTNFDLLIIDWYRQNKRDLPWRHTKNPYYIWLSEVILQQTRVDQGLNYYLKFIDHYPTIHDLAKACEQEVLNDWQGLGYYSRARNIHFTAKFISENLNGEFPTTYPEILKLKGIGEYTAAAIASFCFQQHYAVLDGNVFRVLSRVFEISEPINETLGKKTFKNLSQELLPQINSDIYNQAIMEFGAIQCVPKNPNCNSCVLSSMCLAFANNTVSTLPVKTTKIKITKRYFYYFVLSCNEKTILNQRTKKDIWEKMYEFPLYESTNELDESEILNLVFKQFKSTPSKIIKAKKHILSHQHILPTFIEIELTDFNSYNLSETEKIINQSELGDFPLPRLIDKYLEENFN